MDSRQREFLIREIETRESDEYTRFIAHYFTMKGDSEGFKAKKEFDAALVAAMRADLEDDGNRHSVLFKRLAKALFNPRFVDLNVS